jgi:pilus assembly protein FimV
VAPVNLANAMPDPNSSTSAADGTAQQQARLEIVPARDTDKTAGVTTGQSLTGTGKRAMSEEEALLQTKEELAARELELNDLRERVEQLEAIGVAQEKLLAAKNTALAQAQAQLAKRQAQTTPNPAQGIRDLWQAGRQWIVAGALLLLALITLAGARSRAQAKRRRQSTAFLVPTVDEDVSAQDRDDVPSTDGSA